MGLGLFFAKLFGSEKSIDTVVEKVSSGLDKLVYTEEERSQDAAKERAAARSMVVQWMEHTSGQNLARRLIALAFTGAYIGDFLLAQIFSCIGVFHNPSKMATLSMILKDGMNQMTNPVMLILAFYFAAPHMGSFAEAIVGKFKKEV